MSEWLNNEKVICKEVVKPCKLCGYCPYGQLVEEYPFSDDKKSCEIFGHDCPAFYQAEWFAEEETASNEEIAKMIEEFEEKYNKKNE